MNRFYTLILLIILNSCSLDTKSGIWTQEKEIKEKKANIIKILEKEKSFKTEFNSNLKIKLDSQNIKNQNLLSLSNNLGILNFQNDINRSSKFKFSKIKNFNYFEPEIVFDGKNFIFFDDKSNLIKFDDDFKVVWKKNFYNKEEKKFKPILTLTIHKNILVVVDNIGKIYAVDTEKGDLIWSKLNKNPFNSQVKIYDDSIYAIDLNNILISYSLKNGKQLWKFNTENTFLKSNKRNSLVLKDNVVYFNNSLGDITAVNAKNGSLIWQKPTQSSSVYESLFSLTMSDLVIYGDSIIFSNNKNQFYSFSLKNGLLNWRQDINSSIRSVVLKDYVIAFSNEGYFFVIDNDSGNILRVTDTFNFFETKKRKKIKPVGFILNKEKIFLTTDNGRLLIINVLDGKTEKILKIDNQKISRPFVFDTSIVLLKDDSVIRLN